MADFDFLVNVSGLDGIVDKMSQLPDKLQRKGAKAASRRAMNLVRNAARAGARKLDDPTSDATIWRNIITQDSPRGGRRIGGVNMRVGVRGGANYSEAQERAASGNPGGYTWYWRFLELGTKHIPAEAFLLPAMESQAQAVTDKLAQEMWQQLDKLAGKA